MIYQLGSHEVNHAPVIATARGDVTGDNIPDTVYLTGSKQPDSPFIKDITLVVQDGWSNKLISVPLTQNAGYNPTLFLGDFTGNGVSDVLVRIDSGGSGATTFDYIYSFLEGTPQKLFDSDVYNDTYQYSVIYQDNYKVEVISKNNNMKYIIDISNKGSEYLNEIYNSDGTLKHPIEGFINPLSALFPVDIEGNGVYGLLAFQRIAGQYNADGLGYIQNFLTWNSPEFILFNQYLGILGTDV